MKKNKITPILMMLLMFFSLPIGNIAAQPQTSQTPSDNFVIGIGLGTAGWDPAAYTPGVQEYYFSGAIEGLFRWYEPDNNLHPLLATNWTIYPRAPETGQWENYSGGIKAIAFSLRQNVKFHDGSDFNATVVDWNLNRTRVVSGNESGQSDVVNYAGWYDVSEVKEFFTPHWNLSWGLGSPNIFGTDNMIPIVNKTEIINPYLINITLNPWSINLKSLKPYNMLWQMISMESYKDYANKPLPALSLDPSSYPGHLIGTGPYKFDYIDEQVTQMGRMIKFNNYWNRTALEADGWFTIEEVNIRHFADANVRTTALLNGEVDWVGDQRQIPITDHQKLIDNPIVNVYPIRYDRAPLFVSLMCKEGLDTPAFEGPFAGLTPRQVFPMIAPSLGINTTETPMTQGINRTIRQALSYAFNYQGFEKAIGGWGQVSQHIFGPQSQFYNPAIPAPYYNITEAREILLNDPYYGALCADRGLTLNSTDAQWNSVAASNPLETHTMLYPAGTVGGSWGPLFPVYMEPALASIGCGFESSSTDDIITSVITGKFLLYDMVPFMLDVTPTDPREDLLVDFTSGRRFIPHFDINLPHMANTTFDDIVYDMQFRALNTLQDEMDFVANHIQNYDVPWLVIERYNISFAMNAGFDYHPHMPNWYSNIQPNFALISGTRILPPEEFIPGYSEFLILLASGLSIIGIIYVMMRKKKQILS